MIKSTIIAVILGGFVVAAPVLGQLTPDEAMAKLKEKQAARDAQRNKLVTITQGELDDMNAKIASLQSQLLQLKATATGGPPKIEAVQSLAVGETRDQVLDFLRRHPRDFELVEDKLTVPHTIARTTVKNVERQGSNAIAPASGGNVAANQNESIKQREMTTEEGDPLEIIVAARKAYQEFAVGSHDEYNGVSHSKVIETQKQLVTVETLSISLLAGRVTAIDRQASRSRVGSDVGSDGGYR